VTRGLRADQVLTSPLFDLSSGQVDLEAEKMTKMYTEVIGRAPDSLSAEDQEKLQRAMAYLDKATVSPHARFQAHQAYEVMEASVRAELERLTPEDRKRIEAEIRVQLAEVAAKGSAPS
jgi:hypothetical protein